MAVDFKALAEQFNNVDFEDVGSWPIAVKMVAIALLSAAVLGAGYWFDTRHQLDQLAQTEKKEKELIDVFTTKQMKAINLDAYKQQMAEMERSFGAMLRQLPGETEVAELLVDISQAGLGNGLEFVLFKPEAEKPEGFYAELPISIKVVGNYHNFGQFISDVAALPRIVTLHNITITGSGGKATKLTMSAQAKTYRYLEEKK